MSKTDVVIRMLEAAGPSGVTSRQFIEADVYRYSARLKEARDERGVQWEKERVKGSLFVYRLVKVSATNQSIDRESSDNRGADLGRAPNTLGDRSSSPDPQDAAFPPQQVTNADGSRACGSSASLLLFEMPVATYLDAA